MAPFRKFSRDSEQGCQIDCLIQTKRSLYVVEIKRKNEIGMEIIDEVEQKIARLPYDGKLSVRPVLVYEGRLSPSVNGENYFTSIISAAELFGLKCPLHRQGQSPNRMGTVPEGSPDSAFSEPSA